MGWRKTLTLQRNYTPLYEKGTNKTNAPMKNTKPNLKL